MKQEGFVYDADVYCDSCLPKGAELEPRQDAGGESDTPQHCSHCRVPLQGDLTGEGVQYVLEKLVETLTEGPAAWNRVWTFPDLPPAYRTEAVVGLARGAADTQNHGILPVLADALEDAGLTDPEWLGFLRGPLAKYADLDRVYEAVVGNGDNDDYYRFQRQVDITRGWATDLKGYYYPGDDDGFVDRFLELTAEGADHWELLAGYIGDDPDTFNNYVGWTELRDEWLELGV